MSEFQRKENHVQSLLEKGNFDELYSLLKDSKSDIFLLVEACFFINKLEEGKKLFNSININELDNKQIGKYNYLKVNVLALEEDFSGSINLGESILSKFNYTLRQQANIIIKICSCYRKQGKIDLAIEKLKNFESKTYQLSEFYRAEFNNALGLAFWSKGEVQNSLNYFKKTLELFTICNDEVGIARAYNNQAIVYNDIGDLDKALEMYFQSIKIQERLNNKPDVAILYNNIAVLYQKKGLLTKSIDYYESGLNLAEQESNLTFQAIFHANLGGMELDKGNLHKSMAHLEQALKIFQSLNQKQYIAVTLSQMSETFFELGEYARAKKVMFQSLDIKRDLNNKLEILLSIYSFYWNIYAFNENFDKEILSLLDLVPHKPYGSKNIHNYVILINSILYMKDNQYLKAKEVLLEVKNEEGIEYNHKIMLLKSLAIVELELLKMKINERNFSNFTQILSEIIKICEENNLIASQCDILFIQARFESLLLQFEKALETLNIGFNLAKKGDLNKHITFFTKEINLLNSKMNKITIFPKNVPNLEIEELKNYFFSISQLIKRDSS